LQVKVQGKVLVTGFANVDVGLERANDKSLAT
jgi:hypothetical protein